MFSFGFGFEWSSDSGVPFLVLHQSYATVPWGCWYIKKDILSKPHLALPFDHGQIPLASWIHGKVTIQCICIWTYAIILFNYLYETRIVELYIELSIILYYMELNIILCMLTDLSVPSMSHGMLQPLQIFPKPTVASVTLKTGNGTEMQGWAPQMHIYMDIGISVSSYSHVFMSLH